MFDSPLWFLLLIGIGVVVQWMWSNRMTKDHPKYRGFEIHIEEDHAGSSLTASARDSFEVVIKSAGPFASKATAMGEIKRRIDAVIDKETELTSQQADKFIEKTLGKV